MTNISSSIIPTGLLITLSKWNNYIVLHQYFAVLIAWCFVCRAMSTKEVKAVYLVLHVDELSGF